MGHMLERALEVWMVVVGLCCIELSSGAVKWDGFEGDGRSW